MRAGRLLAFRIGWADPFDNTLRGGALAASADRKHDHPVIDFDENRRALRRLSLLGQFRRMPFVPRSAAMPSR